MTEAPNSSVWGAPDKEKKRLKSQLKALRWLQGGRFNGCGIVSAYHKRRIAPLMARTLPLYRIVVDTDLSGSMMSSEEIDELEIRRRLKETFEAPLPYPDPQQPVMLPDTGAHIFVCSDSQFSISSLLLRSHS